MPIEEIAPELGHYPPIPLWLSRPPARSQFTGAALTCRSGAPQADRSGPLPGTVAADVHGVGAADAAEAAAAVARGIDEHDQAAVPLAAAQAPAVTVGNKVR